MSVDVELQLDALMLKYQHDPLGWVMVAYPWGEPGTDLANQSGPQRWQADILNLLGAAMRAGKTLGELMSNGLRQVFSNGKAQIAVASGKGIGKSALVAWIVQWAMSTFPETRGTLTAGTKTQLTTKTWPEFAKWFNLLICKHWFKLAATSMHAADPQREKNWRVDAVPWSEQNKEAFAGLHNFGKRQFVVFDEASQIADPIWETTDGIMTDANTEVIWIAFGNPTRNVGRFRECWGRLRHRWQTRQIDSRTVAISDKAAINQWVEDYGEDSDYVRVNVRGMFPRVSSMQFISEDLVSAAQKREIVPDPYDPLVLGVDVARFGDDMTVLAIRRGRDCRAIPWVKLQGADTMAIATAIHELNARWKFDAIHIDGGGIGAGVVDRCRQLNMIVRDVQFGGKADRSQILQTNATKYANKRAEMWGVMREWLPTIAIPLDTMLHGDLVGLEYGMNAKDEIILESKEDMKRRGLASPDHGDALALLFAYPVDRRHVAGDILGRETRGPTAAHEYNPIEQVGQPFDYPPQAIVPQTGIAYYERPSVCQGRSAWASSRRKSPSPRCRTRSRRRLSRRPARSSAMLASARPSCVRA